MPKSQPLVMSIGRRAWAALGIAGVVVLVVYLSSQVSIILTPFVLALFPAALANPVASRLRATKIPDALVALLLLLALILAFVVPAYLIVPAFIDQIPQIADSVVRGLDQVDEAVDWSQVPGDDVDGLAALGQQAADWVLSADVLSQGMGVASVVGNVVTGLVLMLVTLFFFLKDGARIWRGFSSFVPARHRDEVDLLAGRSFWTIGAYLRAQLLVALVDAVFIGLGLWLLDVPLVLPLATLVFFGGLFPIVGAVFSGLVAVAVALADQGPLTALAVLGVVLLVQQLEGNVLEPIIQGKVISLHPLLIIMSVTAGGVLMGVLGAFLAVPVAAVIARIVDHLRGRPPAAGPGSQDDETAHDQTGDDAAQAGQGASTTT